MEKLVKFDEESIKEYLDKCIKYWREEKDNNSKIAVYYIDAFQSVRISLFGKILGFEE